MWPGIDHKYILNYLLNPCACNWWKLQKLKNWKVASNPSFPIQLGKGDGWAERNPELFHFAALIHNNGLWGNINLSLSLEEKAARYLFATLMPPLKSFTELASDSDSCWQGCAGTGVTVGCTDSLVGLHTHSLGASTCCFLLACLKKKNKNKKTRTPTTKKPQTYFRVRF